jgi:hypothetical protein
MFSCRRRQTRILSRYSRVRNASLGGTECRPDGGLHASCEARREGAKSLFQEGHQTSRPVTEDHHAWWLSSHPFRPPRAARQLQLAMRPSQPHTPSCPMSGQCVRSARTFRWARWGKRRMARSRCLATHNLTHARTIYLGGFVSQDPKYGVQKLTGPTQSLALLLPETGMELHPAHTSAEAAARNSALAKRGLLRHCPDTVFSLSFALASFTFFFFTNFANGSVGRARSTGGCYLVVMHGFGLGLLL